jgi:hypothetical protein
MNIARHRSGDCPLRHSDYNFSCRFLTGTAMLDKKSTLPSARRTRALIAWRAFSLP